MTVLISGTGGFIGARLFAKLQLTKGILLPLALRWRSNKWLVLNNDGTSIELNSIKDALTVDCLVLVGAFTPKNHVEADSLDGFLSNLESLVALLRTNTLEIKKIIYLSTLDVYDFSSTVSESSDPRPNNLYSKSKLLGEQIVKAFSFSHQIELTIARVGTVYGPGEDEYQKVIPAFIRSAIEGNNLSITTKGDETRAFLFVDDLVIMLTELIQMKSGPELVNLVGAEDVSVSQLARLISSLAGVTYESCSPAGGSVGVSHNFDRSLMNNVFQLDQVDLETGISMEIDAYRGLMN